MSEKREYLKVGSYTPPDEKGEGEKIERAFFGQGEIFKDEEAFYNRPDDVCYIPELTDTVYTRNDFLHECNGQTDLAEELFEAVDWQHPESLKQDWFVNNEWVECEKCGRIIDYGDGCNDKKCPSCGWEVEE